MFAADVTELEALLRLQSLRTLPFGDLVYYGLREVVGAADSLVLEFGNCLNFRHYWPLCRQVIFISPNKALIQTTTEAEQWCQVMNTVLERDADDATAKLRHKASVDGGVSWQLQGRLQQLWELLAVGAIAKSLWPTASLQ